MTKYEEELLEQTGHIIKRDNLIKTLRKGKHTVTFTKKDGTKRIMECTLDPDLLPAAPVTESKPKKINYSVLAVWDLEAKGFRSFRLDSIIEVC